MFNEVTPNQMKEYRTKLAKLVQEDILYDLEHTPKAEKGTNRLERLKILDHRLIFN